MADGKWTSRFFRSPDDEAGPEYDKTGRAGEGEPAEFDMREPVTTEPPAEFETLEPVTEVPPAELETLEVTTAPPAEPPVAPTPVEAEPRRVFAGTGISWAFIVGTLITVAIIVLAVQNTDRVPVTLYFWDLEAPLIIVMLVAALAAIVVDELIGMIIRRRRRRVMEEREELKRLRARTGGTIE